jgi:hypothetical protein
MRAMATANDPPADLAELRSCGDLRRAHVARAVGSRQGTIDLLRHLAGISAPDSGAPKVLRVFAWMAKSSCEWLEGSLRVALEEVPEGTRVDLATDLGGGVRERVMPTFVMKAPLQEFRVALRQGPRLVGSLEVQAVDDRRLALSASEETSTTSAPPPSFAIAPDSLFGGTPATPKAPARDVASHPEDEGEVDDDWDA